MPNDAYVDFLETSLRAFAEEHRRNPVILPGAPASENFGSCIARQDGCPFRPEDFANAAQLRNPYAALNTNRDTRLEHAKDFLASRAKDHPEWQVKRITPQGEKP